MSRSILACLALVGSMAALPANVPTVDLQAKDDQLVDKVRAAIDTGIRFLKKEERSRGEWERGFIANSRQGGCTALTLLALLNCGVKADDPIIRRGLDYLRQVQPRDTYVVGLQTMVFAEIGDPKDFPKIQRNVQWLVDARVMNDNELRGWSYTQEFGTPDNSNTQYALLGLHAGKQAGAQIAPAVWDSIFRYYADTQIADGGWIYSTDNRFMGRGTTLTMTIAGLCGLHIAGAELNAARRHLSPDGSDPECGQYPENEPIQKAMKWLAADDGRGNTRFRFEDRLGHSFYNIYGIERAGRLSGQRFLAGHDWYRAGCEHLVKLQHEDGSWWEKQGMVDAEPVLSTSFALLFLSKGRTPILISKFAHGSDEAWNNKHHDARHLAEYASKELFKRQPLAWQVYDTHRVDLTRNNVFLEEVGNLLQSPILYLNGHESPLVTINDSQKQLLKRYIEEGGFLFAEACCNRQQFTDGFRRLMSQLFPDAKLEPLRADHPIWSAHALVTPGFAKLEGIELGCKTVVVFSPQALAGYWELNQYRPRTERVPDSDRATNAFRLAGNIVAYATGLEMPKPRLTKVVVDDIREERRAHRGFLEVAQVQHNGDWQPAPKAMTNLMSHLRNVHQLDVALQKKEIHLNDPNLFLYKFLYMHGRKKFDVAEAELENLRADLKTGGTLLADACCGKKEFDTAFRVFAAKLFPDAKLEPIPVTDAFFGAEVNGSPITSVRVRKEKPDGTGAEAEYHDAAPFLEGIKVGHRWVVIYSKYDIGCALENHQSSDCRGHDKASALRLGAAAVLYALKK